MSFFDKVVGFFTGSGSGDSPATALIKEVGKHFPPGMSEAEKAAAQLAMSQELHKQEMDLLQVAKEGDEEFNQRIKDLEGTASDLKGVPFLGPLVIFLRGCQRPIWGFATLLLDFNWFSSKWTFNEQQDAAAYVINVLVLGFLFGERAAANVLPYVAQVFKAKAGVASNG